MHIWPRVKKDFIHLLAELAKTVQNAGLKL